MLRSVHDVTTGGAVTQTQELNSKFHLKQLEGKCNLVKNTRLVGFSLWPIKTLYFS